MSGGTASRITLGVGLDLQDLYDDARAAASAYRRLADRLAQEPNVCTHPEEHTEVVDVREESVTICRACDRQIHSEETT